MVQTHDPRCAEWDNLRQQGRQWAEIARAAGLSESQVRQRVKRWKDSGGTPTRVPSALSSGVEEPVEDESVARMVFGDSLDRKGDIIFEDKRPQPTSDDIRKLLDAYLAVMDAAKPLKTAQRVAHITITGNLPVGVVHFSDQHTGAWGWAARRMLEDYRLVAEAEGTYLNFLGDDWDNFIFNFGKWASVMTPDHQRRISEMLMESLKEKILSIVIGNHLHWTKKTVDYDLVARLAWLSNAVYLGHRGDLFLKVGGEVYHEHISHRTLGPSVINKSNSGRRTADDIGGADIIIEGDRHDPWEHTEYRARKRQVWLRAGTYKVEDDYTDEIGFQQGKWDMPMCILLPDRHRVIPFMDFRDGLDTLEYLRSKYRSGRKMIGV